ncbi:adenylate/guanylate cyclase domain-containing protein [Acidovorax radicis]|jgi:class 3 adenylate cyclase|uniref:adenylate/guanylate cyclase domain-containing protein n=1 Tax=Acidovorax radicis TaxID=758826 RepID=UPI001CF9226C|nr:adenylate/guanylate cyclase domain-containing protein [Acidovorax radicis]UCU97417.1 adenylate/guanylate cyclase domain-containing protein [Acidovorax radicis]
MPSTAPVDDDTPAQHDKAYLRRLLSARNQMPGCTATVDAAIEQAFVRRVAILVLDMCGFSRITQSHGIIHFLAMIHQMEQAARPAIEGNGGEVIKQEADNLFAVFAAPEQALEAALDTLRALDAMNAVLPPERALHVSAGIGYGATLVIANEDLFGAEVNGACKLGEDIAATNEILLTRAAHVCLPPGHYACVATEHHLSGLHLQAHRFERCLFERPLGNMSPHGALQP